MISIFVDLLHLGGDPCRSVGDQPPLPAPRGDPARLGTLPADPPLVVLLYSSCAPPPLRIIFIFLFCNTRWGRVASTSCRSESSNISLVVLDGNQWSICHQGDPSPFFISKADLDPDPPSRNTADSCGSGSAILTEKITFEGYTKDHDIHKKSRIPGQKCTGSRIRNKEFKNFLPKKLLLSSRKYDHDVYPRARIF
jgi:hypothetical protein